ncbi:hypothetical protein AVEN_216682-1 [Araneus ventricosus]|uniref:Uncharacterized protein n=1 Tax=Araneus ventricosus TaxID=182803 RepID=A0A4Y2DTT6_ARAVE|nr:hypothetical protein AVEN_216682-1 [Araneus ventricosus]
MLFARADFKFLASIRIVECCVSSPLIASTKYWTAKLSQASRGYSAYARLISRFTSAALKAFSWILSSCLWFGSVKLREMAVSKSGFQSVPDGH